MKLRTVSLIGLALALAGCGVKNAPVAPDTGAAPAVSSAEPAARPAGTAVATPITGNPEDFGLPRGATITSPDSERAISAAEITRNPGAERDSFFLDPLLN